jgi:hypothetical protein
MPLTPRNSYVVTIAGLLKDRDIAAIKFKK